jgi:VanZ family protein
MKLRRYFQLLLRFIARNPWIAILWTFIILLACSWPGKDIPEAPVTGFDKLVHAGLFGVWTVLWLISYPSKAVNIILAGIAYGVAIEFYQQIMPLDRTFDWLDIAADSVGVFLGFGFKALVLDRYLQRLY